MVGVPVGDENRIETRMSRAQFAIDICKVKRIANAGIDERGGAVRGHEQVRVIPTPRHRAWVMGLETDRGELGHCCFEPLRNTFVVIQRRN